MRLLLLASSLERGGAETHVCSLAEALLRRGHQVTVASAGGCLAEELRARGSVHVTLPLNSRNPLRLVYAYVRLRSLLRKGGYDLLHAHARIPAFLVSSLAQKRGIPLVTTVHARFRARGLLGRLSRWGDRAIAVSEDLGQYLCEAYGMPSEHISVTHNGIDTDRFSPQEGEKGDKLRLVFLSRLDRDCSEGAFLLCRLAPRLRERFPSLEIVIGGGGEMLEELRHIAERINRDEEAPILSLYGHVEDPASLFRSADGVIGVSRAALEAMACATPVILCGNEGFFGVLEEQGCDLAQRSNFCCRDCPSVTEENLYQAVVSLLSRSTEAREELGERLRKYVIAHHDLSDTVRKTETVYEEAIQSLPAKRGELVLCGYYGYGNTGDDALLRAAVARARKEYPDQSVSAMTRRGKRDQRRFGVRCVRRSSFLAVRRELSGASVLVFGGGTLLQEQTSLRSLLYYTVVMRYAQRKGVRTELWGNGLGEPHSLWGKRMIGSVLSRCKRIGLRDGHSICLARALLSDRQRDCLFYDPDLALGTRPARPERVEFLLRQWGLVKGQAEKKTTADYAVVALRGSAGRGYIKLCTEWLALLRGEGIELVFVPMFPREDEVISRRLCQALGGRLAEGLGASDLVGLMAHSQVVCGMRLHALIFASCADTPFVGFGGDGKIEQFCRERGGLYFIDLYGSNAF